MKYVNGKYVPMTPEEITAMQKEAARAELAEKSRPLTADEVNRLFITQNINTVITDDSRQDQNQLEGHAETLSRGYLGHRSQQPGQCTYPVGGHFLP